MASVELPLGVMPATQRRVVRSEWTKLFSLRSTRFSLAATLLLIVGIGLLACIVFETRWAHLSAHDKQDFHPLSVSLAGINFAQLAIGVLGVLAITGEYSTGMIRATLSAVPTRLPVLWGKAAVFGSVAFAITLPATVVVFLVGQAILSGEHIDVGLTHPGVERALLGAPLFLTAMGLFGLGLGAIIRSTAGGIAALAAIIFVLPPIVGLLPASVADSIDPYLPSNAGNAIWTINPDPHTLAPWAGFGIFCAYVAIAIGVAAILLARRDA